MTDFGITDIGMAAMKGVAVSVDPELKVTELTNVIEPFNVWQASDALMYTEPFWPSGTVFVSVVDPGVGTARKACAAKLKDGKYVVSPDNGTLTHLAEFVGVEEIREIDESVNRLKSTVKTSVFHGRDMFAYTAARLAAGVITFEEVGPAYDVSEIVKCGKPLHAVIEENCIRGQITSISQSFGNVFTNIAITDLEDNGYVQGEKYHLTVYNDHCTAFDEDVDYVTSFGFVKEGAPLIFNGSTLYMCIARNRASFAGSCDLDPSEDWNVMVSKR